MTAFTRLVVVGSQERVTLVVPSEDSLAAHLGAMIKLVHEPDPEGDPLTLVHPTGQGVNLAESASSQGLRDGTVVHLVRSKDLPPDPEVSDVSALVTHEFARTGASTVPQVAGVQVAGTPAARVQRRVAATVAAGLFTGIAALLTLGVWPGWALAAAHATLVAVAAGCALLGWRAAARLTAAMSMGGVLALVLAEPYGLEVTLAQVPYLVIAIVSLTLGVVFGVCERRAAPALGSAVGIVLGATGAVASQITSRADHAAAIVALALLVALALQPQLALSLSGLTKLDDLRNSDTAARPITRGEALTSIAHAYEGLQWVTVTVSVAICVVIPGLLTSASGWLTSLGVILAGLALLRTRVVPLTLSRWALALAATLGLGGSAVSLTLTPAMVAAPSVSFIAQHPWLVPAGLAVVFVLAAVIALVTPSPHLSARLRRQGDLVESMLAIAVVPVMLGGFGVYTALLGVF